MGTAHGEKFRPQIDSVSWYVEKFNLGGERVPTPLREDVNVFSQTISDTSQDFARVIEDFKSRHLHVGGCLKYRIG
jgi:hypothetical protein